MMILFKNDKRIIRKLHSIPCVVVKMNQNVLRYFCPVVTTYFPPSKILIKLLYNFIIRLSSGLIFQSSKCRRIDLTRKSDKRINGRHT